jgi:hypothetical protein
MGIGGLNIAKRGRRLTIIIVKMAMMNLPATGTHITTEINAHYRWGVNCNQVVKTLKRLGFIYDGETKQFVAYPEEARTKLSGWDPETKTWKW